MNAGKKSKPAPIRICTHTVPNRADVHKAWLENDKSFNATSTSGELNAARNLAYHHFFGTTKRRDFPDDESKIRVRPIGEHLYQASYTP